MGFTTVPRDIARLEYSAIRLPLTLLDEHVVARYWDDEAILRLGFEKFLGSLDGLAGRLLADHDLSRRGQALIMGTGYLANADELDAQARLRRMQADEELQAEQAAARRAREQATAEIDAKVTAAYQQEQEERQQVRRTADAQVTAKKAPAKKAPARQAPARQAPAKQAARRSGPSASSGRGSGSPARGSGSPARGGQSRRAASS